MMSHQVTVGGKSHYAVVAGTMTASVAYRRWIRLAIARSAGHGSLPMSLPLAGLPGVAFTALSTQTRIRYPGDMACGQRSLSWNLRWFLSTSKTPTKPPNP